MRIDAVTGTSTQLASTGSGTPRNCFLGSGCIGYFVPGPRAILSDGQSLYLTGYSGTVKKLDIASGEWLTVAARSIDGRPPLAPADSEARTVIIRVKGADLTAFLGGQISRDEAIARMDVRVF